MREVKATTTTTPSRTEVRAKITGQARRLFSDRGFHGCSIGDIAAASGVNRALLYYYFKNKDDIYRAVIDDVLQGLLRLWDREDVKSGGYAERLDAYLDALATFLAGNRDFIPFMLRELAGGGGHRIYLFRKYLLPNFLNLSRLLNAGRRAKEFGAVTPVFTAVCVLSGVIFPNIGPASIRNVAEWVGIRGAYQRKYMTFYRAYVRRSLGAAPKKRGASGGTKK